MVKKKKIKEKISYFRSPIEVIQMTKDASIKMFTKKYATSLLSFINKWQSLKTYSIHLQRTIIVMQML